MIKPNDAAVMKMVRGVLLRQYRLDLNIRSVKLAEKRIRAGYSIYEKTIELTNG